LKHVREVVVEYERPSRGWGYVLDLLAVDVVISFVIFAVTSGDQYFGLGEIALVGATICAVPWLVQGGSVIADTDFGLIVRGPIRHRKFRWESVEEMEIGSVHQQNKLTPEIRLRSGEVVSLRELRVVRTSPGGARELQRLDRFMSEVNRLTTRHAQG